MNYKKFFSILLIFILVLSSFFSTDHIFRSQAATIKINYTTLNLEVGQTKYLAISGTKNKVKYLSNNKSVATVGLTGGKITAWAPGTATLTASVNGKKLTCKVTVKNSIQLNYSSLSLNIGDVNYLKILNSKSPFKFVSNNKSVATVGLTGGKITAWAPGKATLTATGAGKKLICNVTVKAPIKLSTETLSLNVGEVTTLKVAGTYTNVKYVSSNKSAATIGLTGGKVTAWAPGTAYLTAYVDNTKLICKVTVVQQSVTVPGDSETPSSGKKVVGYYAAWSRYSGYTPNKIDASKLTHINYSFANIGSDNKIALGYPDIDPVNMKELNSLKTKYPHLKTLIAVGGWSWSGRFSDIALTEASRNAFADSCIAFMIKYDFDGIDIDWEYPVSGGLASNIRRPGDKQNFTLLLKTLREKLDARGKIDKKDYLLSFAGAAGSWYVNNIELEKVSKYVDYANLMTYDIHGTWEQYTGFNAPLYGDYKTSSPLHKTSVDSSVNSWINAKFPKDKIIMGVPFYGYIYKSVNNANNGLYQPFSGGASITYGNIAKTYLSNPVYKRYFNTESKVPYLFNGSTFITYEDETSMELKAVYIKNNDLGGAMIWEISQDPDKILLNALYDSLN